MAYAAVLDAVHDLDMYTLSCFISELTVRETARRKLGFEPDLEYVMACSEKRHSIKHNVTYIALTESRKKVNVVVKTLMDMVCATTWYTKNKEFIAQFSTFSNYRWIPDTDTTRVLEIDGVRVRRCTVDKADYYNAFRTVSNPIESIILDAFPSWVSEKRPSEVAQIDAHHEKTFTHDRIVRAAEEFQSALILLLRLANTKK